MNSCKHCMGVKKNEIGEQLALCEYSGRWENVTLGGVLGGVQGPLKHLDAVIGPSLAGS